MSKDYGYARFWAGALTVLGTLFVLLGFLVAVAAILIPTIGGLAPGPAQRPMSEHTSGLTKVVRSSARWAGGTTLDSD